MTEQAEPGTLAWDYDIPLVNNLFMLRDFLIVIVVSLLGMQVLLLAVGFIAGEGLLILPLEVYAIVGGILAALFLIAAVVVLGNRSRTRFTVSPAGVTYESGPRERRINRIMLVLSAIAGRPGASLIAVSAESGKIAWDEVGKVTVHPRPRVITLGNSWRPLLRLYCPAETFGEIVTLVEAHTAAAASARAERPRKLPRRRWRYVAWTGGVVVATVLGMAHYDTQLDRAWRFLILAAFLILIAGLIEATVVRRLLALGGILLGAYVLVALLVEAAGPITGPSGAIYGKNYEVDTAVLVLSVIGQLALIGMGGWRLFGRGRRAKSGGDG